VDAEAQRFQAVYERYFDDAYDLALRMVGDEETAAAVVEESFKRSWVTLQRGVQVPSLKALVVMMVRYVAITELERKGQPAPPARDEGGLARFTAVDKDRLPGEWTVPDPDLADLVWHLASAHTPKEYGMLDVHLRRGLPVEAIAESLGLQRNEAYTMLSRLTNGLEEWVTAALLMQSGSCPDLDDLLGRFDQSTPSREMRPAIVGHYQGCKRCRHDRSRFPSAADVFASLVLVAPPPALRGHIWERIAHWLENEAPAQNPFMGRLKWWDEAPWRHRVLAVAGLCALVLMFIAAVILLRPGTGSGPLVAVRDPSDVRSPTHRVGQESSVNVIEVIWSPQPAARAYSILWSTDPRELPDTGPDLDGTATRAESPPLEDGDWYFHLRTQGRNGQWTRTVRLGPFLIRTESGGGEASPAPSPSAPTVSLAPTPTPEPEAETPDADEPAAPLPEPEVGAEPAPVPQPEPQAPLACSGELGAPGPAQVFRGMDPVQTVRAFYLLLNEGRYGEAYLLLSPVLQVSSDFSPFDLWAAGYANTLIVNPLAVSLVEQGGSEAVVAVEVAALDEDPAAGTLRWRITGIWVLVHDGAQWLLDKPFIGASLC
jgi:DNA-directed RNA polymerase specialized sigma24 family protein